MPPEARARVAAMPTRFDAGSITVAAAMGVEAWAVRRRVAGIAVHRVGIGLRGWEGEVTTPMVVSIGLAGGLRPDLPPGTVVVGTHVAVEDGDTIECDPVWVDALAAAARRLRYPYVCSAVVTATHLVTGAERGLWADRGYAAVDMESGFLADRSPGLAVVRVILDTPNRELSPRWEHPARAALDPRNFAELLWLLRKTPRYALRAANVLAEALRRDIDAEV